MTHFRDFDSGRKFASLLCLVIVALTICSIYEAMLRDFNLPETMSAVLSTVLVALLIVAMLLIRDAGSDRGNISNRCSMQVIGWLLLGVTYVIVFTLNTTNIYHFLTSRSDTEADLRDMHYAFDTLDKRSTDIVDAAIRTFSINAEAARSSVTEEIRTPLNPGFHFAARSQLDKFEKVVGVPVDLTSLPSGQATGVMLDKYLELANSKMQSSIKLKESRLGELKNRLATYTSDIEVHGIQKKADELLSNGLNTSTDRNQVELFLQKGFVTYHERVSAVQELLKSPLISLSEPPIFYKLRTSPYTSDNKNIGHLYEADFWKEAINQPKWVIAMAGALFLDLALGVLLFFIVLRDND